MTDTETNKLAFVKFYSKNPDNTYTYDFYYTSNIDVIWGLDWDNYNPSICLDLTPDVNIIDKIDRKTIKYQLSTICETSCFSMEYAIEGAIALSWINIENLDEYPPEGRCVLHFGDDENHVNNILENILICS